LSDILQSGASELSSAEWDRTCISFAIAARFTRLAPTLLKLGPHFGQPSTAEPNLVKRIARGMLMRISGDVVGALGLLEPAIKEAMQRRLFSQAYNGSHQWVRAGFALGDLSTVETSLAAIRRCALEAGLGPGLTVDVQQLEAMRWLALGDAARAESLIEAARTQLASLPSAVPRVQIEVVSALVQALLGRLDEAQSRLDALTPADGGPDADQTLRFWACAQLAARRGEPVLPWLQRAREVDPNGASGVDSLDTRYLSWRLAPPTDAAQREALRAGLYQEAQAARRLPLLAALATPVDGAASGLQDPWFAACPLTQGG
jgi:hypothetical protein